MVALLVELEMVTPTLKTNGQARRRRRPFQRLFCSSGGAYTSIHQLGNVVLRAKSGVPSSSTLNGKEVYETSSYEMYTTRQKSLAAGHHSWMGDGPRGTLRGAGWGDSRLRGHCHRELKQALGWLYECI